MSLLDLGRLAGMVPIPMLLGEWKADVGEDVPMPIPVEVGVWAPSASGALLCLRRRKANGRRVLRLLFVLEVVVEEVVD